MKRLVALASLLVAAGCAPSSEERGDTLHHEASVFGSPTGPGPRGRLCGGQGEPCDCKLRSPLDLGTRAPFRVDSTSDLDLVVDAKTSVDRVPIVMPADGTIVDISNAQDTTHKLDAFVDGPWTRVTAIQLDCNAFVVLTAVTLRRSIVEAVAAHPTTGLHLLAGSLIGYLPRTRKRDASLALHIEVDEPKASARANPLAMTR